MRARMDDCSTEELGMFLEDVIAPRLSPQEFPQNLFLLRDLVYLLQASPASHRRGAQMCGPVLLQHRSLFAREVFARTLMIMTMMGCRCQTPTACPRHVQRRPDVTRPENIRC